APPATRKASNATRDCVCTRNLVNAAKSAGVRRLIAQSIAFVYAPGAGARVEDDPLDHAATGVRKRTVVALEEATREMPEGLVLRYAFTALAPGSRRSARCHCMSMRRRKPHFLP